MTTDSTSRALQSNDTDGEVHTPPRLAISGTRIKWANARAWLAVLILLSMLTAGCDRRPTALDRVQASGTLRVAIDPAFPPFETVNAAGQIVGFDADLAAELARALGVEVHFVTTGYDALYDALTVGRADVIISALYPDPSRSADFSYSRPYFNAGEVLMVPEGSPIATPEDLANRTVACVFGTTGHMTALTWQETLQPPPTLMTIERPTTITTYPADGPVDAVVVDHVSARIATHKVSDVRILTPPVTDEPYAIATRSEDGALMAAIEEALAELDENGTLSALTERWMRP